MPFSHNVGSTSQDIEGQIHSQIIRLMIDLNERIFQTIGNVDKWQEFSNFYGIDFNTLKKIISQSPHNAAFSLIILFLPWILKNPDKIPSQLRENSPEFKSIIFLLDEFMKIVSPHLLSTLATDPLGDLFGQSINEPRKQSLGQYYTSPEIIDLILGFCLQTGSESIMDPACGTGSFLIRAIFHKRDLQISNIVGIEISEIEASISRYNILARVQKITNYQSNFEFQHDPVIHSDFFDLSSNDPRFPSDGFDCIIGNPPYTRQEIIQLSTQKGDILKKFYEDQPNQRDFSLSKRAGIYAYFFIQATPFLKEGGRLGFIVPNSWLDTEYGANLQEFLLNNYKILVILDSKVERWFPQAEINTCIVILEKCNNENNRAINLVRFVQFKKPINQLYGIKHSPLYDFSELVQALLFTHKNIETDQYQINVKTQTQLQKLGTDPQNGRYHGSKWGMYLRLPSVLAEIYLNQSSKFIELKTIAQVRSGIKSGANDWFYLTQEQIDTWAIESQFWTHLNREGNRIPNWILKSPKECNTLLVDPTHLKWIMLKIPYDRSKLDGTRILEYIQHGETQGIHQKRTCRNRANWYDIGKTANAVLLWEMIHFERLKAPYNPSEVFIDHNFFEIIPRNPDNRLILLGILNSTYMALVRELWGRYNLGDGSIKTEKVDIERFPIIDPQNISLSTRKKLEMLVSKFINRPKVDSLLKELGAKTPEEFQIDRIITDRRELDQILFGEVLGLSQEVQCRLYQAIIDLMTARIQKSATFRKTNKKSHHT